MVNDGVEDLRRLCSHLIRHNYVSGPRWVGAGAGGPPGQARMGHHRALSFTGRGQGPVCGGAAGAPEAF